MKKYVKPEMKINVFSVEDTITTASMPFTTGSAEDGQTAKDYVKSVDYASIFK